jgi:CheY-like chemotaxis protein
MSKKKIMIIDDDHDFVDSLKLILSTAYDVTAKYDTDNVVQAITENAPDLVILDVIFPEDANAGFEAARAIAKNEVTGKIPTIILSAVNQKSELAFSFSENDIDSSFMPVKKFVEKPVEPKELLSIAEELLS